MVFLVFVAPSSDPAEPVARASRRLIAWSAIALAATQLVFLVMNLLILMQSADMSLGEALGANFVVAGVLFIVPSLTVAVLIATGRWRSHPAILILGALVLAASVMTSHAAS